MPRSAKEEHIGRIKSEALIRSASRNPERPVEEVLRSRSIHQQHQHKLELYQEDEESHPYADFDFKDAIVKEAILNRPQY